jgi:hypothetical protein
MGAGEAPALGPLTVAAGFAEEEEEEEEAGIRGESSNDASSLRAVASSPAL